jgi:hypothetical protein
MATSRVTTWPSHTALDGTEVLAVDHSNTNKSVTSSSLKSYIGAGGGGAGFGQIVVSSADGSSSSFQCVANGSAVNPTDDRAQILAAMNYAVTKMPCRVDFGPGDYGVTGGMEIEIPQGSRGLYVVGSSDSATRISFVKNAPLTGGQFIIFTIKPSVEPTVGDYGNYLKDIAIEKINFFDRYPVAHATTEESHAIKLRFTINGIIDGCGAVDIGDEAFDLNYVVGGKIVNCMTQNCPSVGGGAAINVQFSDGVLISNNILQANTAIGTRSTVAGSNGVGVEMVSQLPYDMLNITVTNNIIRDFAGAAVSLNNSISTTSQTLSNCMVSNNNINNCGGGVECSVSPGSFLKNTIISANVIEKVDNGILADIVDTDNVNFLAANNVIEEVSFRGIFAGGTGVAITDNTISNTVSSAIRIGTADGVVISGGVLSSCSSGTSDGDIVSFRDGNKITVDGVQIVNSLSTGKVITACERVLNCNIDQATPYYQQIFSGNEVKNCTMSGGINLDGNNYGPGMIIGNSIDTNNTLLANDAISLNSTNQSCVVSNNYIKTTHSGTTHREGIIAASGSNNHVIIGNITVSETPSLGIVDNGTNNIVANNQLL